MTRKDSDSERPEKMRPEDIEKLNQELLRRDNMIKLLQLKLKLMGSDPSQVGPMPAVAEQRGVEADGKLQESTAQVAALDEKVKELEGKVSDLTGKLEEAQLEGNRLKDDLSNRDRNQVELDKKSAGWVKELEGKVSDLTGKLEEAQLEVSCVKDDLSARDRKLLELDEKAAGRFKEFEGKLTDLTGQLTESQFAVNRLKEELLSRDKELLGLHDQLESARVKEKVLETLPELEEDLKRATRDVSDLKAGVAGKDEELTRVKGVAERLRQELEKANDQLESAKRAQFPPVLTTKFMELVRRGALLGKKMSPDLEGDWTDLFARLEEICHELDIRRIPAVGETFNPTLHQAVHKGVSREHPHNYIVREFVPGFTTGDGKVLPADVEVNVNPNYCTNCNKLTEHGSNFCNICGKRLGEDVDQVNEEVSSEELIRAELQVAQELERAAKLKAARVKYKNVLSLQKDSKHALAGLIRICEKEGEYDKAVDFLGQLAKLDSRSADVLHLSHRIEVKVRLVENLRDLLRLL